MEQSNQDKTIPSEPHVTILGEVVGGKNEVPPRQKCDRGRGCPCGRYNHCRCGGGIFGLVVIAAGLILLLNNFGALSWNVWEAMVRFWPALIIVIGLKLLLGKNIIGRVITALVALVLVAFIIVVGLAHVGSPVVANMHLPGWIMNIINQVK